MDAAQMGLAGRITSGRGLSSTCKEKAHVPDGARLGWVEDSSQLGGTVTSTVGVFIVELSSRRGAPTAPHVSPHSIWGQHPPRVVGWASANSEKAVGAAIRNDASRKDM